MRVREGLKTCHVKQPHPIIITHTHTDDHSPSLQIMVLSAAPVRQTVRGSLAGVPQGSVIGLLEKPTSGLGTYRYCGGLGSAVRGRKGYVMRCLQKIHLFVLKRGITI